MGGSAPGPDPELLDEEAQQKSELKRQQQEEEEENRKAQQEKLASFKNAGNTYGSGSNRNNTLG